MRDYLWSKFQQTCAISMAEMSQKSFKKVISWMLHFHENITNAKLMKLAKCLYLHKRLNFAEDWGVTLGRKKA